LSNGFSIPDRRARRISSSVILRDETTAFISEKGKGLTPALKSYQFVLDKFGKFERQGWSCFDMSQAKAGIQVPAIEYVWI